MANPFKKIAEYAKDQKNKYVIAIFVTVLIALFIFALNFLLGDFLKKRTYDFLVTSVGGKKSKPDQRVVLLLIDEFSMMYGQGINLGNWPWSRYIYSDILSFINKEGKPKAIFFDILFSESDKGTHGEMLNDEVFQNGIFESQNVYQNIVLIREKEVKNAKKLPLDILKYFKLDIQNAENITWKKVEANDFTIPIPCLRSQAPCDLIDGTPLALESLPDIDPLAKGVAVASFRKDSDGVYRRGRILFNYGKTYFPSISLAAIKALSPGSEIEILPGNIIKVGKYRIPVDENGDYLINYYKPSTKKEGKRLIEEHRVVKYSMSGILESAGYYNEGKKDLAKIKPSEFKDKIVIIGCSAIGCEDLKNTPISPTFPGPELHADIISNILQGNHLIVEKEWFTYIIILFFILACVNSIILSKSPWIKIGVPGLITIVYAAIALWLFYAYNYLSPILEVLTTSLFSSGFTFVYLSMTEGAERRKYSKILGNMIDPGIVSEALKDMESLRKGGEKVITAFFSDVAGFSTISEQLSSEDLAALLNEYLSAMTIILKEHGGTLDKYIGDAVVGIFGAPLEMERNELDAARASLDMIDALDRLRKEWKGANKYTEDAQNMTFRIGLNTGKAKVGFMGTENLASYTMMGDTVNLAARLEAAAKDYGVYILISETTKELVWEEMFVKKLDAVRVKGKIEPVSIYELVGRKKDVDEKIRRSALAYEEGFFLYSQKKWTDAIGKFKESEKISGKKDKSAALLIDRCRVYRKEPPPDDWDGTFTRTHK